MERYYKIGSSISGYVNTTEISEVKDGRVIYKDAELPKDAEEISLEDYNKIQENNAEAFLKARIPAK